MNLLKLIDWFLPRQICADDFEKIRQARTVSGFILALMATAVVYAALYYVSGSPMASLVQIIAFFVGLFFLLFLRRFGLSPVYVHSGLAGLLILFALISFFAGGDSSPLLLWVAIIPLFALQISSRRSGLVWVGISIAFLTLVFILVQSGVEFRQYLEADQRNIVWWFLAVGLVLVVFSFGLMANSSEHQAKKMIHDREQKYRLLAENTTDAIWLRDLDLNLIYMSPSIERIRGFTAEEIKHLPLEENLTPDSLKIVYARFKKELANALHKPDQELVLETQNYCKDGSVIWVEDSIKFIRDEQGKPVQIIGVTRDITKRKQAEENLAKARKELVENAHRSGMADIAADTLHNVGNLLNSVKTSAHAISTQMKQPTAEDLKKANQFLQERFADHTAFCEQGSDGQKLIQYYQLVENAMQAERKEVLRELRHLVTKIDSITDVIASQQRFAGFSGLIEKYSVERLIRDVLEIESPTIEALGIEIEQHHSQIPEINIQKTKLLHIMVNLIKNAEEAMTDTPRGERKIRISLTQENSNALISVSDNGVGMSQETLNKVFTHGFTTKEDGYGFGLHSCALYMDDMNGTIRAESEGIGKGSTFLLALPVTE